MLEVLRLAEKHGLVHTTTNHQHRPAFICNCCPCCCGFLGTLTKLKNPRGFVKSNFMPKIDHEACKRCDTCVNSCPFNALYHHYPHAEDLHDDEIRVIEENCVGCGVCSVKCPQNAITMVKVRDYVPVERAREMWMRFKAERIH
ncbi:MAG: ATP-binding protein [Candidatus Freyarchaeota archaeon]|nr:4Fe-4S binding protein [Candidatus Freyrarchaeum guaymaensis]